MKMIRLTTMMNMLMQSVAMTMMMMMPMDVMIVKDAMVSWRQMLRKKRGRLMMMMTSMVKKGMEMMLKLVLMCMCVCVCHQPVGGA